MPDLKASYIMIANEAAQPSGAAEALQSAQIDGVNMFTGSFAEKGGLNGIIRVMKADWDLTWKVTLKETPPADLPEGAEALLFCSNVADDPVAVYPEDLRYDGKNLNVVWRREHLAEKGADTSMPSRYCLLIVPKAFYHHGFKDVDAETLSAQKRQKQIAADIQEAVADIVGGLQKPLRPLSPVQIRKNTPKP